MLEINFLPWLPWNERSALPNSAGVYVIAKEIPENVVYVGRTWGTGGLRDRIKAFNRSATTGAPGHAGGVTFHRRLGHIVDQLLVRVHVPIAINPAEQIMRPYIDFAEKLLIWQHVQKLGHLPLCNSDAAPRQQDGS